MISAICFPTLIVYKPLPGQLFEGVKSIDQKFVWMGCINMGTFFCFMAAGVWCSLKYFNPSETNFSKLRCCLVIFVEILCTITIVCASKYASENSKVLEKPIDLSLETIGLLAVFCLGFLHGFTSSYFEVLQVPITNVPLN